MVTVSDTRTADSDKSGPAVEDALLELGALQIERTIVPDDADEIKRAILEMCSRCDVVFTTGGTGFAPRDVTPETTAALIERRADNITDLIRSAGIKKTAMASLSRGVAGIRDECLIINLPGSPSGARDGVETLGSVLPHLLSQLRGEEGGHEG